ncbi:MAG: hypothetical protein HQL93_00355 [Magnetococcales bacterium]|nr:hypothetical protein [Magnetococcales bacterium]
MNCQQVVARKGRLCEDMASTGDSKKCRCEGESVSHHSPGVVHSHESLYRLIFSPQQIEPDGTRPNIRAFDDIFSIGLSVDRAGYLLPGQLNQLAESLIEIRRRREVHSCCEGYFILKVNDIRNVFLNNERLLCIYDTSRSDRVSHADVCCTQIKPLGSEKSKIRNILCQIAGQLMAFNEN